LSAGCAAGLSSYKRQKDGNRHLDQAEKLIGKGDYEGALKEDMLAIELLSGGSPGDRALFQIGLILAYPDNPERDYNKALGYFERVAEEFPESSLKEEARVLEGAMKEILLRESRIKEGEETLNALTKQLNAVKEAQTRTEGRNKGLEESVRVLKKQLNAMKEIDLGTEEKRRDDTPAKTNR
jgi:tetratricopeptide (TPR) repeat protein